MNHDIYTSHNLKCMIFFEHCLFVLDRFAANGANCNFNNTVLNHNGFGENHNESLIFWQIDSNYSFNTNRTIEISYNSYKINNFNLKFHGI